MPPRKKKWTPHNKPRRPDKPPETIKRSTGPLIGLWLSEYVKHTLSDEERELLQQCTHVQLFDKSYEGDEVYVTFLSDEDVPNPRYDEYMEQYKIDYAQYKEELAWWKAEKAKFDAIEAEKKRESDLQLLAELKAKYEEAT